MRILILFVFVTVIAIQCRAQADCIPVKIHALNSQSKTEVLNFKVLFTNASGFFKEVTVVDNDLRTACLQPGKYEVSVFKERFLSDKKMIHIKADTLNEFTFEIDSVQPISCRFFYGFYLETKECVLSNAAKDTLTNLAKTMIDNPNIVIELIASTDSRGKVDDNMKLSECYGYMAKDYLVSQGIDPARLVVTAHGENVLVNRCKDGVKCTKEEHAMNRYVDFKIIRFDFKE